MTASIKINSTVDTNPLQIKIIINTIYTINTLMASILIVKLRKEEKQFFLKACRTRGISMSDRVREMVRSDIEKNLLREEALLLVEELGVEKILAASKILMT